MPDTLSNRKSLCDAAKTANERDNAELIEQFLAYLQRNKGRSARTAEIYGEAIWRLVKASGDRMVYDLTVDDLVLHTGPGLHRQGVNARGRRPHIAAIRGFYAWLKAGNIAKSLEYPKHGRTLPRTISLPNAEKLMWSIDFSTFHGIRDAAMLGLLIGCGLRISGLINLKREQLVSAMYEGKPRVCIRTMEKGDKERQLPVPAEAEIMLRVYLEHPTYKAIDAELEDGRHLLFVSTKNPHCPPHEFHGARRRLSRKAVAAMITRRGLKAGIPNDQLHPHAMRHLFGTELAESDIDILQRKDLMGHADVRSTELYEHLAMRKKIQAMDAGSPLSKMRTPVSDVLERLRAMPSASKGPAK